MKQLFLFIVLAVSACNPDPPNIGNCDLSILNGITLEGKVNYCNATGNQQQTIPATATLIVEDSIFIVHIVGHDSTLNYQFVDTADVTCVYWEGNENYKLYEHGMTNPKQIGILTTNGHFLNWVIREEPCPESTAFEGFKN